MEFSAHYLMGKCNDIDVFKFLNRISLFKVVELRAELTKFGLDTKGVKATLVKRLKRHLADNVTKASSSTDYDPTQPTEDGDGSTSAEFTDKSFVNVQPKSGISFSLSTPRAVKPAPPAVRPVSPGPQLEHDGSVSGSMIGAGSRSGAAAFFLNEVGGA